MSEVTLGGWCYYQRQAKKGNGKCPISAVRVAKLDSIGFDWGSVMTADEKWDATLDDVRRFREEHGRWPAQSDGPLGQWCMTQRQAKKGNRTYPISAARVAKLDAIGFDWGSAMTASTAVPRSRKRARNADHPRRAAPPCRSDLDAAPTTAVHAELSPPVIRVAAESAGTATAAVPALGRVRMRAGRVRERAGRGDPEFVTTFADGIVIKSNF